MPRRKNNGPNNPNKTPRPTYRVDVSGCSKGDVITETELTRLNPFLAKADRYAYSMHQLHLQQLVRQAFYREKGEVVYVRISQRNLRILSDRECAEYLPGLLAQGRNRQGRNFAIYAHVDKRKLSFEERWRYERRLQVEGKYILAQVRVARDVGDMPPNADDGNAA